MAPLRTFTSTNDFSLVQRIRRLTKPLRKVTDDQLRTQGLSLKYRASTGEPLERLIPQAFALCCESVCRTLSMTPYDAQIFGGLQIARGKVAEMKTGEGKTLTATMPTYLHALFGRGTHVVTVNDYLAARDLELMAPVYRMLGLTTGVVTADSDPGARRKAYRYDVTYGTAKEFGFDFLRDRMKLASASGAPIGDQLTQRDLYYVLVDEVDSVLIDEARTPLIIGIIDQEEHQRQEDCFRWAASYAGQFVEDIDFEYDHKKKKVKLKPPGIDRLRRLPQNKSTRRVQVKRLYEFIENAVKVRRDFHLGQHYAIRDGKIAIIDEFTGRIAEGRQWQRGIHQSVEAKEKQEISPATRQGATVTMQTFFRLYEKFGGMSGTVWTSRQEFKKVYGKSVVRVPTHRPVDRTTLPTQVYANFDAKMDAVVIEIGQMIAQGRSVLVGTRSVEKSESLSNLLTQCNIEHDVLNANQHEREAEIIEMSGQPGKVTVATNMAGRGTDFILAEEVRAVGGLHVILTEVHESQRIDWQLIGRGARQGQPGSCRTFVAMDDEVLLLGLGPRKYESLQKKYASSKSGPLLRSAFRYFRIAQRRLERKHLVDRMVLLRQDKERRERHFEMGQDPYCDVIEG